MSAPTHALSRKVLSLTKPKDKIYKTKNDNIKKILLQLYNIQGISQVNVGDLAILKFYTTGCIRLHGTNITK